MKFKGDIIITDPCYIIKENKQIGEYPNRKDFFKFENEYEYPDAKLIDGIDIEFIKEMGGLEEELYISEMYLEDECRYETAIKKYEEDNKDDWEKCDCGQNMEELGIKTYLSNSTIYGDWSCKTFEIKSKKVLGQFCADAGMVAVFLLDEVLKYNPDFDYHINREWTTTLIKDFDGEVEIEIIDNEVRVIGKGNIDFYTTQTGL